MDTYNLFIKDAASTGEYNIVVTPFNGREVGQVEKADTAAVEQAFVNAQFYFEKVMKKMHKDVIIVSM